VLAGALVAMVLPRPLIAQAPVVAPYRPPTIALVQPTGVGTLPRDKPIVVFRFAPGETDDPIDARSFVVTVDGADRSTLFQVVADEAWGSLNGPANDAQLSAGPHAVVARICSVRGACAVTGVSVTIDAGVTTTTTPPRPTDRTEPQPSSRARLIARVLDAVRKILVP
jgi:hypothetical protein